MAKKNKIYQENKKLVTKETYSSKDAVQTVLKMKKAKFDETVDLVFNLNIDPKQTSELVKGTIVLPGNTGKKYKIIIITSEDAKKFKDLKPFKVGDEKLLETIVKENKYDFDYIITNPNMMKHFGKYGKQLGSKGKIPSPKTGTIGLDLIKIFKEINSGKIIYRTDKQGNVHCIIGKVSIGEKKLIENANFLIQHIKKSKPSSVKGLFINSIYLSSTMSPSLQIEIKN